MCVHLFGVFWDQSISHRLGWRESGRFERVRADLFKINVPPGKGCGFVSFDTRQAAEWAIERMQGFWLRGAQLRLAWGRIQGTPVYYSLYASCA